MQSDKENRFFRNLEGGRTSVGAVVTMSDLVVSELAGDCGMDFVWIDAVKNLDEILKVPGEERLPAGTAEAIRAFADFRAKRCETPEELLANFPDAEVCWMFGPNLCLKPEALERMPNLKALLRSGSGLDALPCDWAQAHGVGVYNTPESIAECVAEHAVALLVSFIRQIPQYNERAKAGYEWGKVEGMDWHISHRTLGLVGYGNIARRVEKMMGGFDMRTAAFSSTRSASSPRTSRRSRATSRRTSSPRLWRS